MVKHIMTEAYVDVGMYGMSPTTHTHTLYMGKKQSAVFVKARQSLIYAVAKGWAI